MDCALASSNLTMMTTKNHKKAGAEAFRLVRARRLLRQGLATLQRGNRRAARREERARQGQAVSHVVLRRVRGALGALRRHVRDSLP